ncbi:MAG: hypothetical protein AAGH15_11000 [Myxococcota bacterium]
MSPHVRSDGEFFAGLVERIGAKRVGESPAERIVSAIIIEDGKMEAATLGMWVVAILDDPSTAAERFQAVIDEVERLREAA